MLEEHVVSSQIVNVPKVGTHGSCTIMVLFVVDWVPELLAEFAMSHMQF